MRRLAYIAAFALSLAVPLWAQRGGGGHGGGGGHSGGFGGGHAGFSGAHAGGGYVSGGMRSGSARSFSRPSFSHPSFSHSGFANQGFSGRGPFLHDRFRGERFRNFRFRNNCFGYWCGYPWAFGGYYDPYWWSDSNHSHDDDYEQNLAEAAEMNRQNLEELRMMRQEQADGDRDLYAHAAPAPREAEGDPPKGVAMMPDTVLVFRDQHKEQISNYAIVGQTLWNFSPGHTQKIPLAVLDVPATTKANQDVGVTFRVPGAGEAQ